MIGNWNYKRRKGVKDIKNCGEIKLGNRESSRRNLKLRYSPSQKPLSAPRP